MTKARDWKPDDGHKHYWERQFEMTNGRKVWINLWICRRCKTETLVHPFWEEEAP